MTTVPDRTSQPDAHPGSAVPWRLRAAAEWSWRLLVIGVAGYVLTVVLREFSEIAVPVAVATLLAALLAPANTWLRARMPKVAAAALCVVGLIIVVGTLLTLVGSQVSGGMGELTAKVVTGLDQVREWVRSTFHITDSQFTTYFEQLKSTISAGGNLGSTAAKAGLTATHFVAGTFLALFSLIFFLYDGRRIASWLVGLFPRSARAKVDGAATIAWEQLTSFVRATVLVAFVDAVGIGLGAAVLRVPFAGAIFVLVFLGSFVPIVGALVSGAVAVLLALVAHGPGDDDAVDRPPPRLRLRGPRAAPRRDLRPAGEHREPGRRRPARPARGGAPRALPPYRRPVARPPRLRGDRGGAWLHSYGGPSSPGAPRPRRADLDIR